ncbi:SH2 domain family protein [Acanthocheilonema viteae]
MSLVATSVTPTYDIPRPSQEAVLQLESWYHGLLTRLRSECLVRSEGDFLVRNSISFKGDFVLTVFWNGHALHFQINKDPSPFSSSGFFFQFEEEQFENVTDLVTFYRAHNKPITRNSGCIIKNPVPNTTFVTCNLEPQLEINQNYMKILRPQMLKFGRERSLTQKVLLNETRKQLQLRAAQPSSPNSPVLSYRKPHLPLSDLLSRPLPKPIQSPLKEDQDEYSEIDYDAMEETAPEAFVIPKETSAIRRDEVPNASTSRMCSLQNHKLSLTSLNSVRGEVIASSNTLPAAISASCLDVSKLHWRMSRSDSLPALPKRKVSFPVRDSGCIVDNSDYDQPRVHTTMSTSTVVDLPDYWSSFIEPNNKAHTGQLLERFKQLLLAKKPESCAQLITAEDYRLLRLERNLKIPLKDTAKFERLSGLSLILLPHGQNVRDDLLERNYSLHYLCILSILHQAQSAQRCVMYSAWVHIAHALFYQYGNAFSFLTLLDALCSDLVKSVPIEEYSRTLQKELESVAQKLHRCEPLPLDCPQINIPFMQPLLSILSNDLSPLDDTGSDMVLAMEVDNLWKWLQEGRHWVKKAVQLDANSSNLCNEKTSHGDNFLSTEFILKLLFGSKGFSMDTKERYGHLATLAYALKESCSLNC